MSKKREKEGVLGHGKENGFTLKKRDKKHSSTKKEKRASDSA